MRPPLSDGSNWILELSEASLPGGKLVELTENNPDFVLPAVSAEDGRVVVADHWRAQDHHRQAVQQHPNLGEQISPRDCVCVLIAQWIPLSAVGLLEAAWVGPPGRCELSHATTSEIC